MFVFYSFRFFFSFSHRPAFLPEHLHACSAPSPEGLAGCGAAAHAHHVLPPGRRGLPAPARGPRSGVSGGGCALARACADAPGSGRGVKKGPAFERQRRKMAATTGSGEQGRRARPAEGPRARPGSGGPQRPLQRGRGLRAESVRRAPRRRPGRPAWGGGAGGGRKHGRGPEGPVGGAVRPRSSPGRREGPAARKGRARGRCCAAGADESGGALSRS